MLDSPGTLGLAVVADDLSGATESAATALLRTTRTIVQLGCAETVESRDARVLTVDTDTRGASDEEASFVLVAAADLVRRAPLVVKKVDSLLRGRPGVEIRTLARHLSSPAVVALALPALGRTVTGGVVHVAGVPLRDAGLWDAESGPAPSGVLESVGPGAALVPLDAVRDGGERLRAALRAVIEGGGTPVCDGETDDDLRRVRDAALDVCARPLLAGSGALVGVVAELLPHDGLTDDSVAAPRPGRLGIPRLLVVLGTASPRAHRQLKRLEEVADHVVRLSPRALLDDPTATASALEPLRESRIGVVAIDRADGVRPDDTTRLAEAFGLATHGLVAAAPAVFLAGGATARRALDLLGVRTLRPLHALEHGTVLSTTTAGQVVVTRPGSFGDDDSLADLVTRLRPGGTAPVAVRHHPTRSTHPHQPEESA